MATDAWIILGLIMSSASSGNGQSDWDGEFGGAGGRAAIEGKIREFFSKGEMEKLKKMFIFSLPLCVFAERIILLSLCAGLMASVLMVGLLCARLWRKSRVRRAYLAHSGGPCYVCGEAAKNLSAGR